MEFILFVCEILLGFYFHSLCLLVPWMYHLVERKSNGNQDTATFHPFQPIYVLTPYQRHRMYLKGEIGQCISSMRVGGTSEDLVNTLAKKNGLSAKRELKYCTCPQLQRQLGRISLLPQLAPRLMRGSLAYLSVSPHLQDNSCHSRILGITSVPTYSYDVAYNNIVQGASYTGCSVWVVHRQNLYEKKVELNGRCIDRWYAPYMGGDYVACHQLFHDEANIFWEYSEHLVQGKRVFFAGHNRVREPCVFNRFQLPISQVQLSLHLYLQLQSSKNTSS
jgi:hypothetical protein